MGRTLEEIRADQAGTATLRNVVSVLEAKLALAGRYGLYEYEAAQEGFEHFSETFRTLAALEREQIHRLLGLMRAGDFERTGGRGIALSSSPGGTTR